MNSTEIIKNLGINAKKASAKLANIHNDKKNEALKVYNTDDESHPGVNHLFNQVNSWYLGGTIRTIQNPKHHYEVSGFCI